MENPDGGIAGEERRMGICEWHERMTESHRRRRCIGSGLEELGRSRQQGEVGHHPVHKSLRAKAGKGL